MSNENKIIIFGDDARKQIKNGMKFVYDSVKVTMGPAGRNVMIEDELMRPMATKDGVTVAKYVRLSDKKQDMGAQLLKNVSMSTSKTSFDGTTTSTVLAYKLIENGLNVIDQHDYVNLIDFKRGMDYATKRTIETLKEQSINVETKEDIYKVAMISSNGDEEISELVTEAVYKARLEESDGSIDIESSTTYESYVDFNDAMIINSGFGKYYGFVNTPETYSHENDDFRVLVFDGSMGTVTPSLKKLLVDIFNNDESLLIIAKEFSPVFVQNILQNTKNGLKCLLVTAPEHGQFQQKLLSDIALATLTKVIGSGEGTSNAQLNLITRDVLGCASKVTATENKTYIKLGVNRSYIEKMQGGRLSNEEIDDMHESLRLQLENDISDHCEGLRTIINSTKKEAEIYQLNNRIKNLSSIKATISIHGTTEVEMAEKKQRVEDAVFATSSAIEEGYVLGGGVMLAKIAKILDVEHMEYSGSDEYNTSFLLGFKNIVDSISEPMNQILRNAFKRPKGLVIGEKYDSYDEVDFEPSFSSRKGYNVRTLKYVDDMVESGIIDPTKVIRCALQNANSISSVALTTEAMIFSDSYYTEELSSRANHDLMYGGDDE